MTSISNERLSRIVFDRDPATDEELLLFDSDADVRRRLFEMMNVRDLFEGEDGNGGDDLDSDVEPTIRVFRHVLTEVAASSSRAVSQALGEATITDRQPVSTVRKWSVRFPSAELSMFEGNLGVDQLDEIGLTVELMPAGRIAVSPQRALRREDKCRIAMELVNGDTGGLIAAGDAECSPLQRNAELQLPSGVELRAGDELQVSFQSNSPSGQIAVKFVVHFP